MVGIDFKHSRMERLDDRENPQVTRIPVSFVLSSEPVSWQEVPRRVESMIVKQLNKLGGYFLGNAHYGGEPLVQAGRIG